jgi:CBS domain containing-hemolysin-like protein
MSAGALLWIIPLLLVLIAGSILFSAIETSFFALQPIHIERLKARRADFAAALERLMENPRRLVSALLLCDSLVNLPLIILCEFVLRGTASQMPFWVSALLIFALVVFICDLVPKVVALAQPYRVVKHGVRVMRALMPVVDPLALVLQRISEKVADVFVPEQLRKSHYLSEAELETLVKIGAEEGTLHASESEMIQEIIKLGDKTARDCMTPRIDAFFIPDDLTNEEAIPKLRAERHARVPVYGDTPDEILGVLDARAFLLSDGSMHYTELLIPPSFVPETMKALDLLRAFLTHPQAMAIVVDEHGGTEGVIVSADLTEEILYEAVPSADRELYIEHASDGTLIVDGGARLDDINEILNVHLEEEGIDTIGGLIFNRLGSLPKIGAQLKSDGLVLTVRRVSRKRVEEVLVARGEGGA